MIHLVAAAAIAAAPPAPPPPSIVPDVPVAPPPIVVAPRIITPDEAVAAIDVEVDIRAGAETLWSGPMRVAGNMPASFSRQKSDAPRGTCIGAGISYASGLRSSLLVNLTIERSRQQRDRFQIRVNWDRPAGDRGCEENPGNRTVGLVEGVTLPAGGTATVTGDAGLTVRLRRR